MITDTNTQIRNQILRKIKRIPAEKLKELDVFVTRLEESSSKKDKIMAFAGAWEQMDENLFDEFTDNLIDRRQQNRRRNNE